MSLVVPYYEENGSTANWFESASVTPGPWESAEKSTEDRTANALERIADALERIAPTVVLTVIDGEVSTSPR